MGSIFIRRASTSEEMAGLRALRIEVFVREQGVPEEEELDSLDQTALHGVAWDGREVVATGRLVFLSGAEAQIGRMAVRAPLRRGGIGGEVLRFLEGEARALGVRRILLHAQTYLVPFYRQHGYLEEGSAFQEAGIEHILMRKSLSVAQSTIQAHDPESVDWDELNENVNEAMIGHGRGDEDEGRGGLFD